MPLGTVTNFPNGINAGDEAGNSGPLQVGGVAITATSAQINKLLQHPTAGRSLFAGTVTVPAGGSTAFKPTGISSALFVVAGVYGPINASGTGAFYSVDGSVGSGGTVTIKSYDSLGNAGTVAGTASYLVIGT